MGPSDLLAGVTSVIFGGDDEDDTPIAANAADSGDVVEVHSEAWPRAQNARTAAIAAKRTTVQREGQARVNALRAQLTAIEDALGAQLSAIDAVDPAAREAIRHEIGAELRPKVEAAWNEYRQTAAIADAKTLADVLVAGVERESRELNAADFFPITVGVLAGVASGKPEGHLPDVALSRADRVVRAAMSGSLLMMQRTLIELDGVVTATNAAMFSARLS
jgi:hypothetical protein